jgi:hypothetical protein
MHGTCLSGSGRKTPGPVKNGFQRFTRPWHELALLLDFTSPHHPYPCVSDWKLMVYIQMRKLENPYIFCEAVLRPYAHLCYRAVNPSRFRYEYYQITNSNSSPSQTSNLSAVTSYHISASMKPHTSSGITADPSFVPQFPGCLISAHPSPRGTDTRR